MLVGKFYLDGTPAWLNVNSSNTLIFVHSKQGLFAAFFRYFLLVIKPIVISMLLSSSTCFILHSCSLTNNATDVDFVVKVYLIPQLIYLLKILYFNNPKSLLNGTRTPQPFSPWEESQSCTLVIRSRSTKFTYLLDVDTRWAYIKMWALYVCKLVLSWYPGDYAPWHLPHTFPSTSTKTQSLKKISESNNSIPELSIWIGYFKACDHYHPIGIHINSLFL